MDLSNQKRGLMLVFMTALISGFSIFINKFGVKGIDSDIFTFAKNVLVAIFLISIILIVGNFQELRKLSKIQWAKLAAIGLVGGSIPFILFFRGLQISNSAASSFIHKSMFIFVAVAAVFLLKEKLNKNILIGAVLLFVGNALLLKFGWSALGMGELLVFAATILWAGEQILSKHALKEMSGNVVAFGRMFFGSAFIMIYLLFAGKISLIPSISSSQMGWIFVTSVFLLLYVVSWYNGLKYVPVTVATSVLLLGSVITTVLNLAFSGATVTAGQAFGMLFLVGGVVYTVGYSQILSLFQTRASSD